MPQTVGPIPAGGSAPVVVRYRVCAIAVVGCRFTASTQTFLTDALDGYGHTEVVPVTVQVPITPFPHRRRGASRYGTGQHDAEARPAREPAIASATALVVLGMTGVAQAGPGRLRPRARLPQR